MQFSIDSACLLQHLSVPVQAKQVQGVVNRYVLYFRSAHHCFHHLDHCDHSHHRLLQRDLANSLLWRHLLQPDRWHLPSKHAHQLILPTETPLQIYVQAGPAGVYRAEESNRGQHGLLPQAKEIPGDCSTQYQHLHHIVRVWAPHLLGVVIFEYAANLLCRQDVPPSAFFCPGVDLLRVCDSHTANERSHQPLANIYHYHIHALDKEEPKRRFPQRSVANRVSLLDIHYHLHLMDSPRCSVPVR